MSISFSSILTAAGSGTNLEVL